MPHPPFPCPQVPSLHLPCRTQDTKGVGSAEATHSITTLWPETTVVFSGAATMITSCPLVDARDPGERAGQQAALPLGVFMCSPSPDAHSHLVRQVRQEQPGFHLTDGESSCIVRQSWDWNSWSQERNNLASGIPSPFFPAKWNPPSRQRTIRVMSRLGA